ncbi:aerobic cobaltochelatase subunit CobN [Methanobrevibacter cuticularis]|uniref:Aerobic cobaltochelatase subunit CobN n=1 Tax=Methanobrevibacter cuticularis TaxID=47311 RepID=A0A166DLF8_9EURY|nr:cobaltochelatase subunit CobN [Methanobrevibacter cuticularis]KZX15722.1 aerobic cobaltochelatase subunit CobN [Methanobrevibacter cuticularis]
MDIKFKKIAIISVLLVLISICCINTTFAAVGTVDVIVKDAYNSTSNKYSENGFVVTNATIKVINSTNHVVLSGVTGKDGIFTIDTAKLTSGTYKLNISHSTYLTYTTSIKINATTVNKGPINYMFTPDMAFITSYSGNKEKINSLMSISKRVYYIDLNNFIDESKAKGWMLSYAEFIYLDMYMRGSTELDPAERFKDSPAQKNYKIAYCFGTYNQLTLDDTKIHFIGANSSNNTPHTIENTFIGSYFQAEESANMDKTTLNKNMKNLFDYITFLLGDTSVDPTKDPTRTPELDSIWGIYHPEYQYKIWEYKPSQTEIAKWIITNPGYDFDGHGSLNWMMVEYGNWVKSKDILSLYEEFEKWYSTNSKTKNIKSDYVIIASYAPGGDLVDALIRAYEKNGRAAFNVFQKVTTPSMASILLNMSGSLSREIVAINSLYSWSMDYGNMPGSGDGTGAIDEFIKINVQILKALHDISEYSHVSQFGPQSEWTYAVTIPSFEGVFGAIAVSYVSNDGKSHVIIDGVNKLVETTLGWIKLKEKDNADKKIAVILYNYPPGKAEIGASYLDVFQTLHDLLEQLSDAGYNIGMEKNEIPNATTLYTIIAAFGNKGSWAQGLLNEYVEKNWNDLQKTGQLVNLTQYMKYFSSLNEALRNQLFERWGSGLGDIMVYNRSYIVIPGMMIGNVFITFQPSRGWEEIENYHDLVLPPHQQYITFYKWLEDVFKADAMIHMGTHGTLEFLPGRSIGLQADDWTFELSGIPNIYPYIVSNPGEAVIAKDRAGALVISHMTPAMVISELYGNLTNLKSYILGYENAKKENSPEIAESYKKMILEVCKSLYIDGPSKDQSFDAWLDKTHHLIEDLDNDVITLGLHSLGYVLTGDEMVQEVITIVSFKTDIYNQIKNLLYASNPDIIKLDYYEMMHSTKHTEQVKNIQKWFENFVTGLLNGTIDIDIFANNNNISNESDFYANLILCNKTIRDIQDNMEWESIMKALSGEFVIPGLAADPAYADSLPTGRNIYVLDTTKMPSLAAWEAGKKIVDKLLVGYYEEHKAFPELVGLIMWGTELLRTEGIGIAEFLYLLGVKPTWTKTGVVNGIELIPLDQLKVTLSNGVTISRPRVDVYASAVTSNPYWIGLMVSAVNLVFYNTTDEPESTNYVKKHYKENPSLDRLFGLPGAVLEGTGMSDYIPNTNKWYNNTDLSKELAELYLSRVSYSWSIDENGRLVVKNNRNTYEYLLKNVDLITQNIDSTWRFLDSDDYYDWFGGMLGASQYLGGKPNTAIVDIRNKNDMITRTLSEELEFEIRSMVMNPLYRDALLKTAAGWLAYADKYEYIFGFETVANGQNGGSLISNTLWEGLAANLLGSAFTIDADYKSFSFQSMSGWVLVAAQKGMWKGDPKILQALADKYLNAAIQYGVACCHHTCANLDFNKWVLQISSLSADKKEQYSDILQKATLGAKVYSRDSAGTNGNPGQSNSQGSSQSSKNSQDSSELSGEVGEVGETGKSSEIKSEASSASSESGSSADQGDSKSYEVSESQSSNSSEDSSISAAFIVAVIALIALFAVGYIRMKKK